MASSKVVEDETNDDSEEFELVPYSEYRLREILERLWAMKYSKEQYCRISKAECLTIAYQASLVFAAQDTLIDVKPPVTVCGDTHGQFWDVLRVLEVGGIPPEMSYLFLGDYVDRGKNSVEVILTLFIYKILYPKVMYMLRGNHEAALTNYKYGFMKECVERYNFSVYAAFNDCFNYLPVAAIISHRIFCCHGGVVKDLHFISEIVEISRPVKRPMMDPIVTQLTWNDPSDNVDQFGRNINRGIGFVFGKQALRDFLGDFEFDLLARSHEVAQDGFDFFDERKCVTIFSAPDYFNSWCNPAGMMKVASDLTCSFVVLRPARCYGGARVEYRGEPGVKKKQEVKAKSHRSQRLSRASSRPNRPPTTKRKTREEERRKSTQRNRSSKLKTERESTMDTLSGSLKKACFLS